MTTSALAPFLIFGSFVRNLLLRRHLIWNFVVRDLKGRYVGSLMGFFWSIVHPLVLLVSYTFVFSVIFRVKLPEPLPDNFPLFLFCGILPWLYFQDTILRSCTSVVDHGNLLRKSIFPSEILPVTVAVSNLVTHLVGFSILLVALLWFGSLHWTVLLIPLYLGLLFLMVLGVGWLVAALQVFLRDTSQVLNVGMVLWFWFTPIFYQLEGVPEPYRSLVELNPLSYLIEAYRALLLLGTTPSTESTCILAIQSVFFFLIGGVFFRKTKREFLDVL